MQLYRDMGFAAVLLGIHSPRIGSQKSFSSNNTRVPFDLFHPILSVYKSDDIFVFLANCGCLEAAVLLF